MKPSMHQNINGFIISSLCVLRNAPMEGGPERMRGQGTPRSRQGDRLIVQRSRADYENRPAPKKQSQKEGLQDDSFYHPDRNKPSWFFLPGADSFPVLQELNVCPSRDAAGVVSGKPALCSWYYLNFIPTPMVETFIPSS
ncbi:hypothetical protein ES705_49186 [subsurface metagenome]